MTDSLIKPRSSRHVYVGNSESPLGVSGNSQKSRLFQVVHSLAIHSSSKGNWYDESKESKNGTVKLARNASERSGLIWAQREKWDYY